MLDQLRELLPANRVAAIAAFLTALGAEASALAGAFEGNEAAEALALAGGLLTQLGTVLMFLRGAQRYDEQLHEGIENRLAHERGELPVLRR